MCCRVSVRLAAMDKRLIRLEAENFRSLRKVSLPLGDVNVLVGPHGAGKTNVLRVFDFLARIARTDLEPALSYLGGFDEVAFRGGDKPPASIRIKVTATWTTHSSLNAPDDYELRITRGSRAAAAPAVLRSEQFSFNRAQGHRRRITITGETASVAGTGHQGAEQQEQSIGIRPLSSGLSTLARLSDEAGGTEVAAAAGHLASFRVFNAEAGAARLPSRLPRHRGPLAEDASNLAGFLLGLAKSNEGAWNSLVEDATDALPQLKDIDFAYPPGAASEVTVVLHESGLRKPTPLADASCGTIRLLGLLALLYDPDPPALTCVEEISRGLHPQALELLVNRVREASTRTQFIITTHSPSLVDRLTPDELVVCERRQDGSSAIPAISPTEIRRIAEASGNQPLGDLWFSGALGGDL